MLCCLLVFAMMIHRIKTGSLDQNCWVLEDGDEAVVIDPGCETAEQILKVLENQAQIAAILLTHHHSDHTQALTDLAEKTKAPIFIHPDDAEIIEKGWIAIREIIKPEDSTGLPTKPIVDNQVLHFGDMAIRIIHTPGHTPGSCCFLIDDQLFSGDTLFRENVGRTDLIGGDTGQLQASIKRLLGLDPKTIIHPGHDADWTIGEAQKFQHFPI